MSYGVVQASGVVAYPGTGGAGGGVAIAAAGGTATSGTVLFSNSNGVSFGNNAGTITASVAGANAALSRLIYPFPGLTVGSAFGNATLTVQYVYIDYPVTATRLDALVDLAVGSTTTIATMAIAMSQYAAIFTRNAATLSSLSSGSTQTTLSYASNNLGNSELITAAMRPISVPMNMNLTPGEYYVGFNIVTATSSIGLSTTSLGVSMSMMNAGPSLQTAVNYAEMGAATATSNNLPNGMGLYTAATTGIPASIGIAAISGVGVNASKANIALVFRNY